MVVDGEAGGEAGEEDFLRAPSSDVIRTRLQAFYDATNNASLMLKTCAVCARERLQTEAVTRTVKLSELPNRHRLRPAKAHPDHNLIDGCLLLHSACSGTQGKDIDVTVCAECYNALTRAYDKPPRLSLANGLWLGDVPFELRGLTLSEQLLIARVYPRVFIVKLRPKGRSSGEEELMQNGIRGTVTSYAMPTERIAEMTTGNLMPKRPAVLASLISIAYIGSGPLPKAWLAKGFRVRRPYVARALRWLIGNNRHWERVRLDEAALAALPEDDVPDEVLAIVRQEQDERMAEGEGASYVPDGANDEAATGDEEAADVLPLQYNGVHDNEGHDLSSEDKLLAAIDAAQREGLLAEMPYHVRHTRDMIIDLPSAREAAGLGDVSMWEQGYPCLFPRAEGGFERVRPVPIPLKEHVRWALDYHDRRFRLHESFPFFAFGIEQKRDALASARLQMARRDYEKVAGVLATISLDDLKVAAREEEGGKSISSPAVRLLRRHMQTTGAKVMGADGTRLAWRSQIWSTSIALGPPSLWVTINPDDLHDPIAQVLAGHDIDMDRFSALRGPEKSDRALTIAKDPYAAAKFFQFLVETVLKTLIGIEVTRSGRIVSEEGIFGRVSGYFGAVEAQGRGTLHLHILLWLCGCPSPDRMKALLQTPEFRARVTKYIETTFHASHPVLDSAALASAHPKKHDVAWSRPPNPSAADYQEKMDTLILDVARTKQVHACTLAQCLRVDRRGKVTCKRRAPWPLSDQAVINADGEWKPRRQFAYLNSWTPALTAAVRCNTDTKLLTNAADSNNLTFYVTGYVAKKQGRYHNISALLADGLAYHFESDAWKEDLQERQRLLLFRAVNVLNRQQEVSGSMVMTYLMGWKDCFRSHRYAPLFWSSFVGTMLRDRPELRRSSSSETEARTDDGASAGDEDAPREEGGEDTVRITLNAQGRLAGSNQVDDYRLRGREFESLNVLKYFQDTYETTRRPEDTADLEPDDEESRGQGRPRSRRVFYLEAHPRHGSSARIRRTTGHNTITNIIGRQLPRRDEEESREFYSASMLVLLKPWREIAELRGTHQSWAQALEDYVRTCPEIERTLSAIQHYHSCKSAADQARETAPQYEGEGTAAERERRRGEDESDEEEGDGADEVTVPITEAMIAAAEAAGVNADLHDHGRQAVLLGRSVGVFSPRDSPALRPLAPVRHAEADDARNILVWQAAMKRALTSASRGPGGNDRDEEEGGDVSVADGEAAAPAPTVKQLDAIAEEALTAVDVQHLLPDQRRAFEIISAHAKMTLAGMAPPQLLMQMHGEGGTGKSRVIQTVTEVFAALEADDRLAKASFTGIAASLIGGKTLHTIASIKVGKKTATTTNSKQTAYWRSILYLVIDEMSMLSREMFELVSARVSAAKVSGNPAAADAPFGGVNVIIVGDNFQFPPVGRPKSALYHPATGSNLSDGAAIGRRLYEQFETVVILNQQVRVRDGRWLEFLHRLREGAVSRGDIDMLRDLLITKPERLNEMDTPEWRDAVLVTPRHAVRVQWNSAAVEQHSRTTGHRIYEIPASDRIGRRELTMRERLAVALRKDEGKNKGEVGGLPSLVEISEDCKVMVTFNVETELDLANGARGTVYKILLHEEEVVAPNARRVRLQYMPRCILIQLDRTRVPPLPGLPPGVVPFVPARRSFQISINGRHGTVHRTVHRSQFPMTLAYAFTDYRSQGQTIPRVIVDIATPPGPRTGLNKLSLFNVYVALSRSSGRDTIRLLRDFDESQFQRSHDPDLLAEAIRVRNLDTRTKRWWERERLLWQRMGLV
ncbi:unnamed protein product [Peniophora sp. CBMAI 1063]|nr:unnamed protein product [Peniophora sp. CBMAI 1063]